MKLNWLFFFCKFLQFFQFFSSIINFIVFFFSFFQLFPDSFPFFTFKQSSLASCNIQFMKRKNRDHWIEINQKLFNPFACSFVELMFNVNDDCRTNWNASIIFRFCFFLSFWNTRIICCDWICLVAWHSSLSCRRSYCTKI